MSPKNLKMANKGMGFEQEINNACETYIRNGIANIQKIPTPWKVQWRNNKIISAHPEKKSTVEYRGAVKQQRPRVFAVPVAFECKESNDVKGLQLKNFADHQIEFLRRAIDIGEFTFVLVKYMKTGDVYYIPGPLVVGQWDLWQQNKGKRGFNTIEWDMMVTIKRRQHINIDFLEPVLNAIALWTVQRG